MRGIGGTGAALGRRSVSTLPSVGPICGGECRGMTQRPGSLYFSGVTRLSPRWIPPAELLVE